MNLLEIANVLETTESAARRNILLLDRRNALGVDDSATTLNEVVAIIPTIVSEAVSEAVDAHAEKVEAYLIGHASEAVNAHSEGMLEAGVATTASAILYRIGADLEDIAGGHMDPIDALEGLRRLLSTVVDSAKNTGKPPSETLEYETGCDFDRASASDWTAYDGTFAMQTVADNIIDGL